MQLNKALFQFYAKEKTKTKDNTKKPSFQTKCKINKESVLQDISNTYRKLGEKSEMSAIKNPKPLISARGWSKVKSPMPVMSSGNNCPKGEAKLKFKPIAIAKEKEKESSKRCLWQHNRATSAHAVVDLREIITQKESQQNSGKKERIRLLYSKFTSVDQQEKPNEENINDSEDLCLPNDTCEGIEADKIQNLMNIRKISPQIRKLTNPDSSLSKGGSPITLNRINTSGELTRFVSKRLARSSSKKHKVDNECDGTKNSKEFKARPVPNFSVPFIIYRSNKSPTMFQVFGGGVRKTSREDVGNTIEKLKRMIRVGSNTQLNFTSKRSAVLFNTSNMDQSSIMKGNISNMQEFICPIKHKNYSQL